MAKSSKAKPVAKKNTGNKKKEKSAVSSVKNVRTRKIADSTDTTQAWERGESVVCAKDESILE